MGNKGRGMGILYLHTSSHSAAVAVQCLDPIKGSNSGDANKKVRSTPLN